MVTIVFLGCFCVPAFKALSGSQKKAFTRIRPKSGRANLTKKRLCVCPKTRKPNVLFSCNKLGVPTREAFPKCTTARPLRYHAAPAPTRHRNVAFRKEKGWHKTRCGIGEFGPDFSMAPIAAPCRYIANARASIAHCHKKQGNRALSQQNNAPIFRWPPCPAPSIHGYYPRAHRALPLKTEKSRAVPTKQRADFSLAPSTAPADTLQFPARLRGCATKNGEIARFPKKNTSREFPNPTLKLLENLNRLQKKFQSHPRNYLQWVTLENGGVPPT